MQRRNCKKFTYQTRIKTETELNEILTKTAYLLSKVERHLYVDLYQNKKNINNLKSDYITRFNITARQFNSCRIKLEGKVSSLKEIQKDAIYDLENKTKKLKKHIKKLKDDFIIHQKKRRLFLLEEKLKGLKKDKEEDKVRLCFGTKNFFRKQFFLEENGYSSHEEWKKEFRNKRNDSFFIVGSKDESSGNQTCQLIRKENSFSLQLRLPNIFFEKYIIIENVSFSYGEEEIINCLEENEKRKQLKASNKEYAHLGKALSYLFKYDKKGWRVFVTIEKEESIKSKREIGAIGVDINVNHIAIVETDRFGNPIYKKTIPCCTYGKSKHQSMAIISDACKEIAKQAIETQKPIIIENLDFTKKKLSLREQNVKYKRMLSSFSYSQIINSIDTKCFKEGIKVYKVNPAFTSIIGRIKFAQRYGLSIHHSAALAIARRVCKFSERPPRYLEIDNKDSKSAFFLHDVNRKKHVWNFYSWLNRTLKASNALKVSTIFRSSRPKQLLCDSKASILYRGSFGTLVVNNTAWLTQSK